MYVILKQARIKELDIKNFHSNGIVMVEFFNRSYEILRV
jgi:hypothetical protein